MHIAVLGSGGGGLAVAFDCAAAGHDVALFDFERFPRSVEAVRQAGGIEAEGDLLGFQRIAYAGHDIGTALDGADVVYAVGPAYSTRPFAEACRAHLKPEQIVIVCPGSCGGALEFKQVLTGESAIYASERDASDAHDSVRRTVNGRATLVAETSTLPYAVRVTSPGKIRVFLKLQGGLFLAALPSRRTHDVLGAVRDVYPQMEAARNVLQTSLQNGNPVIHPAVTLLNTALIERTQGDFLFYEEGVTTGVGRVIEAVDRERIAIGEKLGLTILPDPELGRLQGYMTDATYDQGYIGAPGFRGIRAQSSLDHRYLNEDVGYGLVFMKRLGEYVGVATPHMDSLIHIASAVMNRNYLQEAARTPAALGLTDCPVEELTERL